MTVHGKHNIQKDRRVYIKPFRSRLEAIEKLK